MCSTAKASNMSYPNVADRFTLDKSDVYFCASCREIVIPEEVEDFLGCPFCSLEVTDYGSFIDAVCDRELDAELHGDQ